MAVTVKEVDPGSAAQKGGIRSGEKILTINGQDILDVLDYRFYQDERRLKLEIESIDGKVRTVKIRKGEYEDLGLEFEDYLMDRQHSCKNGCIFCFIDQMPKGMRETLYFKDDDSRLSFLFGNYITLTNLSEHEISRIIKMHISPMNISVHTTNPELRCKMMKNRFAGQALEILGRFNDAKIRMNCQLVLCPGYNDGEELRRTLSDLSEYEWVTCVAAVPVGLTKYREGLAPLKSFDRDSARAVLKIFDEFGEKCLKKYGERRMYAADEFYLCAGCPMPSEEFYGDFDQLDNGVGMWTLFKADAMRAIRDCESCLRTTRFSVATGVLAEPLLREVLEKTREKFPELSGTVYAIRNDFFGEKITVSGLVTGGDLIRQLSGKELGDTLLIPRNMLRYENDLFLDDVSVTQVEESLGVRVVTVENDGYAAVETFLGISEPNGRASADPSEDSE